MALGNFDFQWIIFSRSRSNIYRLLNGMVPNIRYVGYHVGYLNKYVYDKNLNNNVSYNTIVCYFRL